ncbi:hypothetical protein AKJ16_DCAP17738 [Drosera capensis]
MFVAREQISTQRVSRQSFMVKQERHASWSTMFLQPPAESCSSVFRCGGQIEAGCSPTGKLPR